MINNSSNSSGKNITLNISTLYGFSLQIDDVRDDTTIAELKKKILDKISSEPDHPLNQQLFRQLDFDLGFAEKLLTDSKITLKEYGISKETPLHLIFKFDNENTKLFQVPGYSVFNSNQFGTNLGATYIDKEGKCKFWYIKYPSIKEKTSSANENNKIRAKNEVLAAKLFELACGENIVIPEYKLITLKNSRGEEIYGVASEWIHGFKPIKDSSLVEDDEKFAMLYVINAWINNWDGVVQGNFGFNSLNQLGVIDFGGGLNYRANPQPNESIYKTVHYNNPKAFNGKTKAIKTMRDQKKNSDGYQFFQKLSRKNIEKAVQQIINLSNQTITATVLEYDSGSIADKKQLAETLIRRKYDLARRYKVLPKNLNRYSFFPEIAKFLLPTYLYQNAKGDSKSYRDLYKKHGTELTPNAVKRIKHGIEHAVRTANYIDIFNELHRKHDNKCDLILKQIDATKTLSSTLIEDKPALIKQGEKIFILYGISYRSEEEQKLIFHKLNAELYKSLTFPETNTAPIVLKKDDLTQIQWKDILSKSVYLNDPKPLLEDAELIKMLKIAALLHDAGRNCDIGGETEKSEKRSATLCRDILEKLGFDKAKINKVYDAILYKDQPEEIKDKITEACRTLLHDADCLDVLRSHSHGWKFKPTYLNFYEDIAKNNWTARKDLFSVIEQVKKLLNSMGDSPQPFTYFEKYKTLSGCIEKISIAELGEFSLLKKEHCVNSLTPYDDIYIKFLNNKVLKRYLQNAFIAIPVFIKQKRQQQKLDSRYISSRSSYEFTTDIKISGQSVVKSNLPYAEYYTDSELTKNNLQRHHQKFLVAKGNEHPPAKIIACGGFHPNGLLQGEELRKKNALDVLYHRTKVLEGSGVVSTTKKIKKAKWFAFYQNSNNEGYVYMIITPPGTISFTNLANDGKSNYSDELEYTVPAGFDQEDIIAYRKVRRKRNWRFFVEEVYIREIIFNKYDRNLLNSVCQFLLKTDEYIYFPISVAKRNSEQVLTDFWNCIKEMISQQEGQSPEELAFKPEVVSLFDEYISAADDELTALKNLLNQQIKADERNIPLKICTLLAVKFSCDKSFSLLIPKIDDGDQEFLKLILHKIIILNDTKALKKLLEKKPKVKTYFSTLMEKDLLINLNSEMILLLLRNDTLHRLLSAVSLKFQEVFELWLNKAENDKNNSLRNLLLCQKYKTLMQQKNIVDLTNKNIDDVMAKFLAEALKTNTTLISLDLSENYINVPGAKFLAEALKINTTLISLDLSENYIITNTNAEIDKYLERNKCLKKIKDTVKSGNLVLNIKIYFIDAKIVNAIGEVLKTNKNLTTLKFSSRELGDEEIKILGNALKKNNTLTCLKLSSSGLLGDKRLKGYAKAAFGDCSFAVNTVAAGAKAVAEALKTNAALTTLRLNFCNINAAGAEAIAEALKTNAALTTLRLGFNNIGTAGAEAIAEALKTNAALTTLGLGFSNIGTAGAEAIAEALRTNKTLTRLDLSWNNIDDTGAEAIAEALKKNTTLISLNLSNNNISAEGAEALAKVLKKNTTLTSLDLSNNNIGAEAETYTEINKCLERNSNKCPMQIFIKDIYGYTYTIEITGKSKILDIKTKLLDIIHTDEKYKDLKYKNLTVKYSHLIYAEKPLEDEKTVADYNFQKETTLHFVFRPPSLGVGKAQAFFSTEEKKEPKDKNTEQNKSCNNSPPSDDLISMAKV